MNHKWGDRGMIQGLADQAYPGLSHNEKRKKVCEDIRCHRLLEVNKEVLFHPKSKVDSWDRVVYAGIVERIGDFFLWSDTHWTVGKYDLLSKVEDWNTALEQYCDDIGITGAERKQIVQLHKASALAPCANGKCNKMEGAMKQFSRCSNCKAVGYCSPRCQKDDWKLHKLACDPQRHNKHDTTFMLGPGLKMLSMVNSAEENNVSTGSFLASMGCMTLEDFSTKLQGMSGRR